MVGGYTRTIAISYTWNISIHSDMSIIMKGTVFGSYYNMLWYEWVTELATINNYWNK